MNGGSGNMWFYSRSHFNALKGGGRVSRSNIFQPRKRRVVRVTYQLVLLVERIGIVEVFV